MRYAARLFPAWQQGFAGKNAAFAERKATKCRWQCPADWFEWIVYNHTVTKLDKQKETIPLGKSFFGRSVLHVPGGRPGRDAIFQLLVQLLAFIAVRGIFR